MKSEEEIIKITNAENENIKIIYSQSVVDDLQTKIKRLKKENEELLNIANNGGALLIAEKVKTNKYKQALEEIREIAKHWLNNDWSCYHCRNNMDEKLKEIIKLMRF